MDPSTRVDEWARAWFGQGGIVHAWQVSKYFEADEHAVAEWKFECTWAGERHSFEGASIATIHDGKIATLRGYQTTAPLYDWEGEWRP
jgi:hypothetical protein